MIIYIMKTGRYKKEKKGKKWGGFGESCKKPSPTLHENEGA
jgi:hypothetical protein